MSGPDEELQEIEQTAMLSRDEIVRELASTRYAYLIVIGGPAVGRMYRVLPDRFIIGRDPTVELVLDDASVSRHHVEIVSNEGGVTLVDLGSTNGVFVNGEQVQSRALVDGDKIQVGKTSILKFSYQDALEENFQQQLYRSATRDELTGACNKKFLLEQFHTEISYSKRHRLPLSLVFFDLDHFKKVNDTYGHLAGDHVLRQVADTVTRAIRAEDHFARYGGEEFALLLRATDAIMALQVAERVRKDIAGELIVFEGQRIAVTVSLGISTLVDDNYDSPDAMLEAADRCLYRAKENGRNRTVSDAFG